MRTTLTLDDDLAARLRALQVARGLTWRATVNCALRRGLDTVDSGYRTTTVDLGVPRISIDSVADALASAEGHRRP